MKGSGLAWEGADLILRLYVQPNASKECFAGEHGPQLRIKLQTPALEGQANKSLCQFLAQQFGVQKRQVILERGERGRYKRVRILAPVGLPYALDHFTQQDRL
jgi:uncharacterized protein